MNLDARTHLIDHPAKKGTDMNFVIVLARGSDTIESIKSLVPDKNDFRTASMMAAAALFSTELADNVTAYAMLDNGSIGEEYFFYGQKY